MINEDITSFHTDVKSKNSEHKTHSQEAKLLSR